MSVFIIQCTHMCISNNNDLGEEIHFQDKKKEKERKKKFHLQMFA